MRFDKNVRDVNNTMTKKLEEKGLERRGKEKEKRDDKSIERRKKQEIQLRERVK